MTYRKKIGTGSWIAGVSTILLVVLGQSDTITGIFILCILAGCFLMVDAGEAAIKDWHKTQDRLREAEQLLKSVNWSYNDITKEKVTRYIQKYKVP